MSEVAATRDYPDFTRATLLLGKDADGELTGVLLDSEGNLNAILKGQGAEGLQTIAVDEEGRLEVFVLDADSQWGKVLRVGNAELAPRLGSPVSYDWRGQVFWMMTFGNGMGSAKSMSHGTGGAVTIDPEYSLSDGFSLKLKGGSDGGHYAMVYGYGGQSPSSRLGISIAIAGYAEQTEVSLRTRTGATRYAGKIRYVWATNQLYHQKADGNYQLLDTQYMYGSTSVFNRLKLVIDGETHKYVRLLLNDVEYDLSAEAMYSDAGGVDGTAEFEIETLSREGSNDYQLLDHIILTVNEP